MKSKYSSIVHVGLTCISIVILVGCRDLSDHSAQTKNSGGATTIHSYKTVSGRKYSATGLFVSGNRDSVEIGNWLYSNLDTPLAFFGKFETGVLSNEWKFFFTNGTGFVTQWTVVRIDRLKCLLSLPFSVVQTNIDSSYTKLTAYNDSLGKVSIIIGVKEIDVHQIDLLNFGPDHENGILAQGYTILKRQRNVDYRAGGYYYTEYNLQDTAARFDKLFNTYAFIPSKKFFVEITLFHDGNNDYLVQLIYDLIVSGLYIDNERFYNPYS
jgi:hypothetical protein